MRKEEVSADDDVGGSVLGNVHRHKTSFPKPRLRSTAYELWLQVESMRGRMKENKKGQRNELLIQGSRRRRLEVVAPAEGGNKSTRTSTHNQFPQKYPSSLFRSISVLLFFFLLGRMKPPSPLPFPPKPSSLHATRHDTHIPRSMD